MISHCYSDWRFSAAVVAGCMGAIAVHSPSSLAQVRPDNTLGQENSQVQSGMIRGIPSDRIRGGVRRSGNLFHSFEQFDVPAGRGAYFENPDAVQNIFSRVTGGDRSEILGRLGVLGDANLFFMNPNGILFGPNARLDVGGSFSATTADAIGFGDLGFFSATDPEIPSSLLTVDPSAFLFSQIPVGNLASITNLSRDRGVGLLVRTGQNLLLLGGNVVNNGGSLGAYGGRVEIGAVAGTGIVELNPEGSLNFPENLARGDVTFTDRALVDVTSEDSGDIQIYARNIDVTGGSTLWAGIYQGSGSTESQAGDVILNATGAIQIQRSRVANIVDTNSIGNAGNIRIAADQLRMQDGGFISASTLGQGNAGDVDIRANLIEVDSSVIEASTGILAVITGNFEDPTIGSAGNVTVRADQLNLDRSGIRTQVGKSATGNAGNILLNTDQMNVLGGAQVSTATYGNGDAGNLTVQANQINLSGTGAGPSGLFSIVETTGKGEGGDIRIEADQLRVADSATINASTRGTGNGGELLIRAEQITIDNGSIESSVERSAIGSAGNLRIEGNQLQIQNGGTVTASTRGRGNAGNLTIRATEADINAGWIGSQVLEDEKTQGNGGNVTIDAQRLNLRNGAEISASTFDNGNAGNVTIYADQLNLSGFNSVISSTIGRNGQGQGGNLYLEVDRLQMTDQSSISATTQGLGNAGNITIRGQQADLKSSSLIDTRTAGNGRGGNIDLDIDRIHLNNSYLAASVTRRAINQQGGSISIGADELRMENEAIIAAQVVGSGNGGDIAIQADRTVMDNSFISTAIGENTTGNAGDITISGRELSLENGSQISPSTFGNGNAGNLTVKVDQIDIVGRNVEGDSSFSSNVEERGNGRAGNIVVEADRLRLADLANISASVEGVGEAGDITIRANQVILDLGFIRSQVRRQATRGAAGDIELDTQQLSLINGGQISAASSATGNAGNITIRANEIEAIGANPATGQPSGVFSILETEGRGESGDITLNADRLYIDGGLITVSTGGTGNSGNLLIAADQIEVLNNGQITASVDLNATGNGGNLTIQGERLDLRGGGQVLTSTFGNGNAGNLTVQVDQITLEGTGSIRSGSRLIGERSSSLASAVQSTGQGRGGDLRIETNQLQVRDGARISAATEGLGDAGDVTILAQGSVLLNGASPLSELPSEISSSTATAAEGTGGTITIDADIVQIGNGAVINARTANAGRGGNIAINANALEATNGGQAITTTLDDGQAGNITLNVRDRLMLSGRDVNLSQRRTALLGNLIPNEANGESGLFANTRPDTTGNGGTITIQAREVALRDGATIAAATAGAGNAGNILVQDASSITLDSGSITTAINPGAVLTNPTANQGNIGLQTQQLSLTNGAEITASTAGQGNAGRITVRDADTISLDNQSRITTTVNPNAIGSGGDITLQTGTLGLDNRSRISSSTAGQGDTGAISIDATDSVQLRDRSQITSEVQTGATGNSQQITIRTPDLSLRGDSTISAATNGRGRAGDVRVLEADRVSLSNSTISTEVGKDATVPDGSNREAAFNSRSRSNNNPQSNITINTRSLDLDNNARITASTRGQGNAGDITVNADTVDISNGSRLTTSTSSDRSAGNILLNVQDTTEINGDGSGIFANTTANGNGGSITVNTETLNLNDQARISAQSTGRGEAGDIRINTNTLNATNSTLETAARRSSGGTIAVNPNSRTGRITLNNSTITTNSGDQGGNIRLGAEQILLRGDSDITTSSGGDGGNIDITAASIIAFDDSDILANSNNARGGNITLDTPAFFGSGYVPDQGSQANLDGNGRVDINASGSTASGTITTPDTSFIQNSLNDLPDNSIDTDQLLANSCIVRDRDQPQGQFIITGADGLPDRPGSIALPDFPTGEIRNIPTDAEPNDQPWQLGDPVVEPQGVYRLPDGRLVMSRECL